MLINNRIYGQVIRARHELKQWRPAVLGKRVVRFLGVRVRSGQWKSVQPDDMIVMAVTASILSSDKGGFLWGNIPTRWMKRLK